MQLLWTWSHSNSNNEAVVRAWGLLAMLKTLKHILRSKKLSISISTHVQSAAGEASLSPAELGGGALACRWVRMRSSGQRAGGDGTEQCAWQGGRPSSSAHSAAPRPSNTRCSAGHTLFCGSHIVLWVTHCSAGLTLFCWVTHCSAGFRPLFN